MEPLPIPVKRDLRISLMGIPALCLLIAAVLFFRLPAALFPFVFGFAFGYAIQRSRFCMAGCFRDIFLLRSTSMARALIVALLLTTAGFVAAQVFLGYELASLGRIYPVGLHTMLGGMLFGFGMVIAGACVSGCLVRMGEGYFMQYATFAGLLVGSILGAWNLNWWLDNTVNISPTVFLPEAIGWPAAVVLQVMILLLLFMWMNRIEGGADAWSIFRKTTTSLPYGSGAVLLSVLHLGLYLLWKRPWGITSGIAHAGGWLAMQFKAPVQDWKYFSNAFLAENTRGAQLLSHPLIYLALAMVLGSMFSCLLHQEFRLRRPRTGKYYTAGLLGGILMGYGSRLAFGCNIGALLSAISSLSLHGWVFAAAVALGAAVGGKVLVRWLLA